VEFAYSGSTLWAGLNEISVQGDYVYCVVPYGLLVLDVSDPAAPVLTDRLLLPGQFWDHIASSDQLVFLLSERILQVIDISSPSNPVAAGVYYIWGTAGTSVAAVPGCSCAAVAISTSVLEYDCNAYVQVVNATDPWLPVPIGGISGWGCIERLTLSSGYLLTSESASPDGSWMRVLSIANPAIPEQVGIYSTDFPSGFVSNGDLFGGHLYVAYGMAGLIVVDTVSWDSVGAYDSLFASDVQGFGDDVFVVGSGQTSNTNQMVVLSVADPRNPVPIGLLDSLTGPRTIQIVGSRAYLGGERVQIADITEPTAPVLAGVYEAPWKSRALVRDGDVVAVAADAGGLQLVDVSDPSNPAPLTAVEMDSLAGSAVLWNHHVYVSVWDAGLYVVDISDPSQPLVDTVIALPTLAQGLWAAFGRLYVALGYHGLYVFDLTAPNRPTQVSHWDSPGYARGVAADAEYIYLGDRGGVPSEFDLRILEWSDSSTISEVGNVVVPGYPMDVGVYNGKAYLACYNDGVQVVDVTVPSTPFISGSLPAPDWSVGVLISGEYLLVAQYRAGIQVFQLSDTATPVLVGAYDTPGLAVDLSRDGSDVVVADYYGLLTLKMSVLTGVDEPTPSLPEVFSLGDNFPNPFNAGTMIHFTLGLPGVANLKVYNALGQLVTVLADDSFPAGQHEVQWDGRFADGHEAPSGVYFYRLFADGRSVTAKMLLLR